MTGWLVVGGAAAAFDVWAIKTGRETLSCAAGRHPWLFGAAAVGLLLHFNSDRFRRHRCPPS